MASAAPLRQPQRVRRGRMWYTGKSCKTTYPATRPIRPGIMNTLLRTLRDSAVRATIGGVAQSTQAVRRGAMTLAERCAKLYDHGRRCRVTVSTAPHAAPTLSPHPPRVASRMHRPPVNMATSRAHRASSRNLRCDCLGEATDTIQGSDRKVARGRMPDGAHTTCEALRGVA
jgi:hypothetical protein